METIITKEAKRIEQILIDALSASKDVEDPEYLVTRYRSIQKHMGSQEAVKKLQRECNEFEMVVVQNLFGD